MNTVRIVLVLTENAGEWCSRHFPKGIYNHLVGAIKQPNSSEEYQTEPLQAQWLYRTLQFLHLFRQAINRLL